MTDINGKNILITGGTGFIGQPLCKALIKEGARILLWTRRPELVENKERIEDRKNDENNHIFKFRAKTSKTGSVD